MEGLRGPSLNGLLSKTVRTLRTDVAQFGSTSQRTMRQTQLPYARHIID